jgi:hypothetical protein
MSDLGTLFGGTPAVGELDQAFLLLTVASSGAVDTCLLSRMEVRPGIDGLGLAAVVVSRRARANLTARPVATLVAVRNDEMHTLTCSVAARVEAEGASAFALRVTEHRRDGLGIELIPMQYRVDEKLRVAERWDRTEKLLGMLDAAHTTAPWSGRE